MEAEGPEHSREIGDLKRWGSPCSCPSSGDELEVGARHADGLFLFAWEALGSQVPPITICGLEQTN